MSRDLKMNLGLALVSIQNSTGIIEAPERQSDLNPTKGHDWLVTVFDNEFNTYEEVIAILMVATRCTHEEAGIEAWEIDHLGSCVVHVADEEECRRAAKIISTIGIRVEVSQDC